jgi:glutamine synthetase
MNLGVDSLPVLPKDAGDRNRTSPFAFTGNKFEFRAVGSHQSIGGPLAALNTIMAESLDYIATRLESSKARKFEDAVGEVLTEIATQHSAIIFNGNGYSEEWHREAERRGLPNNKTTVEALPLLTSKETITAYTRFGVLTRRELHARQEIAYEQYIKTVRVEANLVTEMVQTKFLPAAIRYQTELAQNAAALKAAGVPPETSLLEEVTNLIAELQREVAKLTSLRGQNAPDLKREAGRFCQEILPQLGEIRRIVDALETVCPDDTWPVPTYEEILFIK